MWILLACARDLAPVDPGALHPEGTRLVDAHGRTVTLRGVNAGGRSKFAPYLPYDGDDLDGYLDRAAEWGVNVLRVPFAWAAMEPSPGDDDEAWLARYDALLDGAAARGMFTIVDAHQDVYAEPLCGDGFPAWTLPAEPAPRESCEDWFLAYVVGDPEVDAAFDAFWTDATGVRAAFGAMWDRVAARHADRPGVIGYEILNEPHRGSLDEDTWGETVYAPFVTELAGRIRAADPDALVFFDSGPLDAIDQDPPFDLPAGDGLVFAPHYYDPTAFLGGSPDPESVRDALAAWAEVGADWDVPVLVGEVGVDPDSEAPGAFAEAVWDSVAALGLGATWWEYSVAAERWNGENFSLVAADGTEAAPLVDALVRPYAALLAGEDLATTRDGDAWTFAWTAADGVTELVWPARLGAVAVETEARFAVVGDRVLVEADGAVQVTLRPSASP
jgi:endoglycosylceramidase